MPRIRPPVLCAAANGEAASDAHVEMAMKKNRRPRRDKARANTNIYPHELTPYSGKLIWLNRFFEVAVLPKPYYNPANLEKADIRVKQKEFVG